jgi:hypothetical protein
VPKRPIFPPHWHANKRWTDVQKTREALSILAENKFVGKTWNFNQQSYYKTLLQKKKLVESKISDPRSARAILATFEYFGFAWVRNEKLTITNAGLEFVKGNIEQVLKGQLLKWQYPNPFEAQGQVAPYTQSLRLFPFRTLLYFLTEVGRLHERESALFVWRTKTTDRSELNSVKQQILDFRNLDPRRQRAAVSNVLYTRIHEYEAHLRPYVVATGLCRFNSDARLLSLVPDKTSEVRTILSEQAEPKTDWRSEDAWFEYFGDLTRNYPPQKVEIKLKPASGTASGFVVKVKEVGPATGN